MNIAKIPLIFYKGDFLALACVVALNSPPKRPAATATSRRWVQAPPLRPQTLRLWWLPLPPQGPTLPRIRSQASGAPPSPTTFTTYTLQGTWVGLFICAGALRACIDMV